MGKNKFSIHNKTFGHASTLVIYGLSVKDKRIIQYSKFMIIRIII